MSNRNYNNLENIDQIIEKFENETIEIVGNSKRENELLSKRKEKIEQLKKLRDKARRKEHENINKLVEENDKLDELIAGFTSQNKQNIESDFSRSYDYSYESRDDGESRNSGESRVVKVKKPSYDPYGFGCESRDSGESRW